MNNTGYYIHQFQESQPFLSFLYYASCFDPFPFQIFSDCLLQYHFSAYKLGPCIFSGTQIHADSEPAPPSKATSAASDMMNGETMLTEAEPQDLQVFIIVMLYTSTCIPYCLGFGHSDLCQFQASPTK